MMVGMNYPRQEYGLKFRRYGYLNFHPGLGMEHPGLGMEGVVAGVSHLPLNISGVIRNKK